MSSVVSHATNAMITIPPTIMAGRDNVIPNKVINPIPLRALTSFAAKTHVQALLSESCNPAKIAGNAAGKHTGRISSLRFPPSMRITS